MSNSTELRRETLTLDAIAAELSKSRTVFYEDLKDPSAVQSSPQAKGGTLHRKFPRSHTLRFLLSRNGLMIGAAIISALALRSPQRLGAALRMIPVATLVRAWLTRS